MPIFRRFNAKDIPALIKLMAVTKAANDDPDCDLENIQAEVEAAAATLIDRCWLAQADIGQVVGYNYLETIIQPNVINFWLRGDVHPNWRGQGFGRELLRRSWTDMQAICAYHRHRPALANAWGHQYDEARQHLLMRFGLRPDHIYHELVFPTSKVIPAPPAPSGVIIYPWADQHCEAAIALRNRAFAQNWGYQPSTAQALRRHFKTGRYEPTYSFTAWRVFSNEMVGLIHACLEWTRKSRRTNEGEIVWLAVAREVRGQGVGTALILTAMNALRQAGVEIISVGADNPADNPKIGVYTKLGFTVREAIIDYRGKVVK